MDRSFMNGIGYIVFDSQWELLERIVFNTENNYKMGNVVEYSKITDERLLSRLMVYKKSSNEITGGQVHKQRACGQSSCMQAKSPKYEIGANLQYRVG